MGARRYFTKPVEVAAIQWDGTEAVAREIVEWFVSYESSGDLDAPPVRGEITRIYSASPAADTRSRMTLKGYGNTHVLFVNDWLLRDQMGVFGVRDHDSFRDIFTLGEN